MKRLMNARRASAFAAVVGLTLAGAVTSQGAANAAPSGPTASCASVLAATYDGIGNIVQILTPPRNGAGPLISAAAHLKC